MEVSAEEEKDIYYDLLQKTYEQSLSYYVKIVIGDMNARVGKEEMYCPTTGKQSLHKNTNHNGYHLIQFAALSNVVIGSTMFQHKNIHKSTWTAPDRSVVSMLASGTQDRGFEPGRSRRIFRAKIPQHAFLRRGNNAVCPMSQLCGM
jgi:hypothetical protein